MTSLMLPFYGTQCIRVAAFTCTTCRSLRGSPVNWATGRLGAQMTLLPRVVYMFLQREAAMLARFWGS